MKLVDTKYTAQGFVEALIAIAVAGIATVVLMQVAVRTIRQTVDNEIEDEKTILATNLEVKLDYLLAANNADDLGDDSAVDSMKASPNTCFELDIDMADVVSSVAMHKCAYSLTNGERRLLSRSTCEFEVSEEIFALACVTSRTTQNLLYIDIVTGLGGCEAEDCSDSIQSIVYPLRNTN